MYPLLINSTRLTLSCVWLLDVSQNRRAEALLNKLEKQNHSHVFVWIKASPSTY